MGVSSSRNVTSAQLDEVKQDLNRVRSRVDTNASNITDNRSNLNRNATQITRNATSINDNRSNLNRNARQITRNATSINDNRSNLNRNARQITRNATSINDNKNYQSLHLDLKTNYTDSYDNFMKLIKKLKESQESIENLLNNYIKNNFYKDMLIYLKLQLENEKNSLIFEQSSSLSFSVPDSESVTREVEKQMLESDINSKYQNLITRLKNNLIDSIYRNNITRILLNLVKNNNMSSILNEEFNVSEIKSRILEMIDENDQQYMDTYDRSVSRSGDSYDMMSYENTNDFELLFNSFVNDDNEFNNQSFFRY